LQSREVPASQVNTPRNLAALRKTQKVSRGFETVFLDEFLASRQKVSLSFLLAHCGGGQDKPGLPWPLSEAPRLSFFHGSRFLLFFPAFDHIPTP